jgi:hypothetical protein
LKRKGDTGLQHAEWSLAIGLPEFDFVHSLLPGKESKPFIVSAPIQPFTARAFAFGPLISHRLPSAGCTLPPVLFPVRLGLTREASSHLPASLKSPFSTPKMPF